MNLPTFSDKGDIDMGEVLKAMPADFKVFGIDVVRELNEAIIDMKAISPDNYGQGGMSDFIHKRIDKYDTEEGKQRKTGYTLSPKYCFWYNIYGLLMSLNRHHMDSKEQYERDLEVMRCERQIAETSHPRNA